MTTENKEKLAKFLKKGGYTLNTIKVLFYDQVDDRRIDLDVWFEESENRTCISGDDSQVYKFSELELIDEVVLN